MNTLIIIGVLVSAFLAVKMENILSSVIALGITGGFMALEFILLHAPDVAISEAAVGAARPKPSPTPSPAPLPAPGSDERIATVAVEMLNLRQQPTTTSRILDVLEAGMKVVAAVESDENGWVAVRTGEQEGYVKAEYLGE